MKIPEIWKAIRGIGTEGGTDKELLHKITLVNALSFSLCTLVAIVGCIYFVLSNELSILIPASIEFVFAASAMYLNYRKLHGAAALVTFFVQCAASLYFGLL